MKRSFVIPGPPMGKARPKVFGKIAITPTKTVNYEVRVQQIYGELYGQCELLQGPLGLNITAYFAIPDSAPRRKKEDMLSGQLRPTKKPDFDNIGKIIADSLNGLAYQDDAAIVSALIQKKWSDRPRVEVEIWEIGVGNM